MPVRRDLAVGALCVAIGVWFVLLWTHATGGMVAFDLYQYWLPNMLYGLQRVRAGGGGLLWNPFQNCGQPSFGISSTGLLYPLNFLFFVADADWVIRMQLVANFAIAGIGMYGLVRELGSGRAGAICAALAFELGAATVDVSTWTPQVSDAYVWMPTSLLFCERLLRRPTFADTAVLGGSIAVSLLSGSPQIGFFTYQLIALRVLFECMTRRPRPSWSCLAAPLAGLALGPLIDAGQLLPGIQSAALSVRNHSLSADDMRSAASLDLNGIRDALLWRSDGFNPILLIPFALAGASWLRASTRRLAIFYTVAGALYFTLAFGPATPLFSWYLALPFGALFREPIRFTWVTSFCMAVLSGIGADAVLSNSARWRALGALTCTGAAVACFYALAPNHVKPVEWALVGAIAAVPILGPLGARARGIAAVLAVGATAANVLTFRAPGLPEVVNALGTRQLIMRRLLPDAHIYANHADVFGEVRRRMTPQDRVYIVHRLENYALTPKTASLFGLPSIDDYEPQPSRRWAEYMVMLRSGAELTNLRQYYFPYAEHIDQDFRKPLLDLAAVRYVIFDASVHSGVTAISPALYPVALSSDLQVEVYENQQALPRAAYVPRAEVVSDRLRLLRRLAAGTYAPNKVVLLEDPPASGFLGTNDEVATGVAEFLVDEPERVAIRVHAPGRGFLRLADQYAPGWTATVDGAPVPILRADYAFRAVEVPAGDSIVEFRYVPTVVWAGAGISAATLAGLAVAGVISHRRRSTRA